MKCSWWNIPKLVSFKVQGSILWKQEFYDFHFSSHILHMIQSLFMESWASLDRIFWSILKETLSICIFWKSHISLSSNFKWLLLIFDHFVVILQQKRQFLRQATYYETREISTLFYYRTHYLQGSFKLAAHH